MADPRFLVDTSVLARADIPLVGERLEGLYLAGKLWTCRLIDLEVVYGAPRREVSAVIAERLALPFAPITPEVLDRALRVAGLMAMAGLHRGAKAVDLVVAAAAEARGLTVLHYDADYDRISKVTRQPTQWIAKAGTLDH